MNQSLTPNDDYETSQKILTNRLTKDGNSQVQWREV